ncbi:MAG: hypothetical protein AABZ53_00890 [Planctomycetota bacterium]
MIRDRVRTWLVSASCLVLSAGSAIAQDKAGDAKPAPQAAQPVLVMEHTGLAGLVSDPRDAGLKRAMEMLPARLAELRDEIPNMPPEAATLFDMVPRMIAHPAKFAIAYQPGEPTGGLFGYGIVLSIEASDEAEAKKNHERIRGLLKSGEAKLQASKRLTGFTDVIVGPPGLLSIGVRKSGNAWRNEVVYGTVPAAEDLDKLMTLPASKFEGMTPFMRGRIDFAALTPAEKMALTMAGAAIPQQVRDMDIRFRRMGYLGEDAMKMSFESGATQTDMVSAFRMEGAGKFKKFLYMSTDPLTEADYKAIPADAVMASLTKGDLGSLRDAIDEATKQTPQIEEVLGQFKESTGVDLRADILDALGGAFGYYMSDSTGGGGLGSSVVLLQMRDRARFMAAHAKLVTKANELIETAMAGAPAPYVKLVPWRDGSTDLTTLRINGIPVPLEFTYAATSKWLVLGLTPQAVIAGARQAEGKGDAGILSNPRVAEVVKGKSGSLIGLTYSDTPRLFRDGYTVMSLVGSAIANGVRSPIDAARDPGLVVPLYNDLAKTARASVGYTFWDGEDIVMFSKGDKSAIISGGAMVGTLHQFMPIIAAAAGGAAMAQQRMMGFGPMAPAARELGMGNFDLPFITIMGELDPVWQPFGPFRAAAIMSAIPQAPAR